jgi:xanthine/uracil permease
MNTSTPTHQASASRRSLMTTLLSTPRVIAAPRTRAVVTGLIVVGALLTAASGVIHLYLWGEDNGYRQIATVGPLFLAQAIVAILLALVLLGTRWMAAVVAAAGLLIGTAAGLLISIEVGMFGFQETWYAPWAKTSFAEELAGGIVLLIAAWPLLRQRR